DTGKEKAVLHTPPPRNRVSEYAACLTSFTSAYRLGAKAPFAALFGLVSRLQPSQQRSHCVYITPPRELLEELRHESGTGKTRGPRELWLGSDASGTAVAVCDSRLSVRWL